MNLAGIYHRPESEMAYLYTKDVMHIRLKTAQDDIFCMVIHIVCIVGRIFPNFTSTQHQ